MSTVKKDKPRTTTPYELCVKCWWPKPEHVNDECPPVPAAKLPYEAAQAVAAKSWLTEQGVNVHPLAETFPIMSGTDWTAFVSSIQVYGIQQPIVYAADGTLVDGRNRLTAWLKLGRELSAAPSVILSEDVDAEDFIMSSNLRRRQMSASQRALAAARAMTYYSGRVGRPGNSYTGIRVSGTSADLAGSKFGVSRMWVYNGKKILEYATVWPLVESGELDIAGALRKIAELTTVAEAAAKPEPGKWDATLKTLEGVGSADVAALMGVLATRIGMRMTLNPIQ